MTNVEDSHNVYYYNNLVYWMNVATTSNLYIGAFDLSGNYVFWH